MPCCRQERLCDLMQFACGQRFRVCTAYAFYHLLFSVVRVLVHFTFSVLICCIDISALLQNSVQHYTTHSQRFNGYFYMPSDFYSLSLIEVQIIRTFALVVERWFFSFRKPRKSTKTSRIGLFGPQKYRVVSKTGTLCFVHLNFVKCWPIFKLILL